MEIYRGLAAIGLSLTVLTSEPACGVAVPTPNPERSTSQDGKGQQIPTSEPQRQVVPISSPTPAPTPDNPLNQPSLLDRKSTSELEAAALDIAKEHFSPVDANQPLKARTRDVTENRVQEIIQIGDGTDPYSDRIIYIDYDQNGKITRTDIRAPMGEILEKYFKTNPDGSKKWQMTPEEFYKDGKKNLERMFNLPKGMQYEESTVQIGEETVPVIRAIWQDQQGNKFYLEAFPQDARLTIYP